MKKGIPTSAVLFIILFIVIFTNYQQEIKKRLGQKIVINKDTCTIVDYSLLHKNYALSNGKIISFRLVDSLQTARLVDSLQTK